MFTHSEAASRLRKAAEIGQRRCRKPGTDMFRPRVGGRCGGHQQTLVPATGRPGCGPQRIPFVGRQERGPCRTGPAGGSARLSEQSRRGAWRACGAPAGGSETVQADPRGGAGIGRGCHGRWQWAGQGPERRGYGRRDRSGQMRKNERERARKGERAGGGQRCGPAHREDAFRRLA